jgi:hypothetical protein
MVYQYGMGDGYHQILFVNLAKNILKLLVSLVLLILGIFSDTWYFLALLLYLLVLPLNKKLEEIKISNILKFPILSGLKFMSDGGYTVGYFVGMLRRRETNHVSNE